MNTRLRDAIQALLSEHLRGLLLAAPARMPVLGSTSIARPDGREASPLPDLLHLLSESGLIDVVSLGGGVLGATLYLGDALVDFYTPDTDLNDDSAINADDLLWPVGQYTIETGIVPLEGDIEASSGSAGTSRALDTQISMVGPLVAPASLFTGKLRLLIQSLYGFKGGGITVALSETWPSVSIGDVVISYSGRSSDILCTTDDYGYYLCSLDIGSTDLELTFRKIIERPGLTAKGKALRAWALERLQTLFPDDQAAVNDPARKDQLESIVLGLSAVSTDIHSTASNPLPSASWSLAYGAPLAYGWHSNWGGTQASIVLITIDHDSFGAGSQTLRADIAHSIDEEGAVTWTVDASLVTEKTKKIENDFFVWLPEGSYQTSGACELSQIYLCGTANPPGSLIVDPPSTVTAFPLFGRYLRGGGWQADTWSVATSTDPYALISQPSTACHGQGPRHYLLSHTTGNAKRHRLTVGGQTVEGFTLSGINFDYGQIEIAKGGSVSGQTGQGYDFDHPLCEGDTSGGTGFPGIQNYTIFDSVIVNYDRGVFKASNTDTQGYSCTGAVAYVVAHDNCEGAFCISKNTSEASSVTQNNGSKENTTSRDGVAYTYIAKATIPPTPYGWSSPGLRSATWTEIRTLAGQNNVSIQTNGPSYTKIKVLYADEVGQESLGELASGTGTPSSGVSWYGGDLDYPAPWGDSGGSLSADWGVFCEAPFGVCSAGVRDYEVTPGVLVSAVFGDRVGHGTPDGVDGLTGGGYEDGDTFVGWA